MKRKIYKLLSIVLTICIVLSVCSVSAIFNTLADTKITDYYVGYSTTSDGSGTSLENPVPSIKDAIEKINANGLTAGDTANIWIVQDIAKPQKVESGEANKPYHNLAYWTPNADSTVPAHEAKIVIMPHADNQKVNTTLTTTYLVMGKQVADQGLIVLGGPTEFKDLKIVYTSSSNVIQLAASTGQSHIIANGYDLTLGNGVTYGYINHNGLNGGNWTGAIANIASLGVALAAGGGTYEKPMTLSLKTPWSPHENAVEIPSANNREVNEYTFKEDVTVVAENPDIYNGYIRIGSFAGGSSTFDKNLNFKLGNIGQIRFKSGAKKAVVKGGVQFIAKANLSYDDGYSYTDVSAWVKEDNSPADLWYLKVAAADLDYINFVKGQTGKFKVATGLQATATPEAGGEAIVSNKGILDLSGKPGVYSIAFEVAAVTIYDYYVEAGGATYSETDEYGVVGTVDAPYGTIADAIKALKANGTADAAGNTANIYIMQDIASPAKVASGVANKPYHNLAYWGEYVEYNANVIIQPYEENQKVNTSLTTTYLAMDRQVSNQTIIKLGGPTEFRDVKIVYCSSSNVTDVNASSGKTHIIANGHNLIMNEGVSYGYIAHNGTNGDNWQGKITDIKNLGISVADGSATFQKPIYLGFSNYWDAHNNALEIPSLDNKTTSEYTFKEDLTVEVNNENMYSGYIRFGSFKGGSSTFEKNLNVKLTNINRIRFKKGAKNVVVKGGVQFIVPNNQSYESGYSYTVLTNLVKEDGTTPADLWYLNVAKTDMSKINFVNGETGKFAIEDGLTATATPKAGGTAITSYEGVLDLSAAKGEYTITFEEGGNETPPPPPAPKDKMLYFKGEARGPFYQRVENLTPNATYTLKFTLSNISPSFEVLVQTNGNRAAIAATSTLVNADNKGKYTVYEYSITLPDKITVENGQETGRAFIGIRFAQQEVIEGYIFDLSLKDANGNEKYLNGNFGEGYLDNWAWGWNVWFNSTKYGETKGEWTHNTEGKIYLEVMDFDESKIPEYEAPYIPSQNKKMLYFKGNKRGPLYQRLENLVPGGTYTFTFEASNNLEGIEVVAHQNGGRGKLTVQSNLINAENKGRYTVYKYSVTLPSELTLSGGVETGMAFIGIRFNQEGAEAGGYVANLSFKDASGNECFENGDFFSGYLDNWAWDWNAWFNSANRGQHKGTWSHADNLGTTDIYLEVMDFDESKMPYVEPPYVPSQNAKMLYFKGTKRGPFYQRLGDLQPYGTYTFKFALSNNVTGIEVVAATNSNRATIAVDSALVKSEDKGRYSIYEYSVTLPGALTLEGGVETGSAFIGIKFDQTSTEEGAYIADLSFKDAQGNEYFENKDFFAGYLDHWAWDWNVWFNSAKYGVHKGTFKHSNQFGETEIYLEVMDFDESKMKDVEAPYIPTPGDKMLYFKGTKRGPLYQRLENLKPGGTYVLTFDASNNITGLAPAAAKNSSRSGITLESKYIDGVDHGRYTSYTYEIVLPDELTLEGGVETYMAFIGVTFSQPSAEEGGYIANLSLKEKINEDTLGQELYKNGDFGKGYLDHWAWEWNVWFNSTKYGIYKGTFAHSNQYSATEIYLEVMDFDESKMQDVKAKLPDYSEKMIYFKNGAITNQFAAWVDSAPGMQYILKYSVFATDEITPSLNANGLRGRLAGNPQLLSQVKGDNYTTYTYKITVPQDYTDHLVFLGVSMPYYSEGYLFDLEAYRADDLDEKKPIWDNPQFVKGFDDWTWGWTVTWFSKEGTGNLTEWSDATHDIRLFKKDLSRIQTLIDDIYRNDGEWWKPTDIKQDVVVKGTANVSGTFKDQNGQAVSGIKLVFKSNEKSYTATTDENGNFSFKNIEEGYYELYFVNAEGEEELTDFYCALANGDALTIDILTDTTPEVVVGTLKGTVYTPELKTVSNIKLYLRGVAETTTDKSGNFDFGEVKAGKYDLYTVLEDGSEYIFRTIEIKEDTDLAVKLKYDVETSSDDVEEDSEDFTWIWIVIACGAVVVLAAGAVLLVVFKKKKAKK